jgi:hypothetical protein
MPSALTNYFGSMPNLDMPEKIVIIDTHANVNFPSRILFSPYPTPLTLFDHDCRPFCKVEERMGVKDVRLTLGKL